MARSYSGCEVLHQDFLNMILPESRFDGVFANASLFHVPSRELPRVLLELSETLSPRGVLFCSNPTGNNEEGFGDGRPGMISPASFDYVVGRVLVASYSFTVAIAARLRHDRLGPNVLQDYFAARESNTVQSDISLVDRS